MKKITKYLIIIMSYFFYSLFIKILLLYFGINYDEFSLSNKFLCSFIIEITYLIILIFIYRKELFEELKDFKNNYKKYLSENLVIYLLGVLLMYLINTILYKYTNQSIATNELKIRSYIQEAPLYMFFSACLYAPFVEELLFRKTIRKFFKNKYIYVIGCGIIFGLLHVSNYSDPKEYLFMISYIIMGIDFAYIYYKTNNIFTTITFHLCHNLILLIMQLL